MSVLIENPAACEIRSVIRFLNARKVKPIEIYRQICEVYGQNAMSDSMVRRWVRQFNEGRSEVHDEERSGRPSLVTEELVHAIDDKIQENRKFTINALAREENVSNWLKTQAANFYEEGIQKLVPRYDKCLRNFGSYVEK